MPKNEEPRSLMRKLRLAFALAVVVLTLAYLVLEGKW
jgi:hypothetical protein